MTSTTKKVNQIHPPLPKKKRVDHLGNIHKRLYVKSGTATMLLCKDLSENAAKVLIEHMHTFAERLGTKIEPTFLIKM